MSIVTFAENEFKILNSNKSHDDVEIQNNVLEVLKVISAQGHSGMSMECFKYTLNKLLGYEPLSPLTGDDSEWTNVSECFDNAKLVFQNKRRSSVFKELTDNTIRIYDLYNENWDGTFPYTPCKSN